MRVIAIAAAFPAGELAAADRVVRSFDDVLWDAGAWALLGDPEPSTS